MKSKVEQSREEIEREQKELKDARMQLSNKRKELAKREKVLKEEEIEQLYDRSLIDTTITWICTPVVTHFTKRIVSYVTLNPDGYGWDPDTNPMSVHSPESHKKISIVLPSTYVKYSGKVRVTIEPIVEEVKEPYSNGTIK